MTDMDSHDNDSQPTRARPNWDIFETAQKGTLADVKYIIEKKGYDVNTQNHCGREWGLWRLDDGNEETMLHWATHNPDIEVVKYLIAQGASVNAKDCDGATPLHDAAMVCPNPEVLEYLIAQGADVNAIDVDGGTPLDNANADEYVLAGAEERKAILRKAGGKTGEELQQEAQE